MCVIAAEEMVVLGVKVHVDGSWDVNRWWEDGLGVKLRQVGCSPLEAIFQ